MRLRSYLVLCVAVALVTALSVLYVPGLSDLVEGLLLGFLSSTAR